MQQGQYGFKLFSRGGTTISHKVGKKNIHPPASWCLLNFTINLHLLHDAYKYELLPTYVFLKLLEKNKTKQKPEDKSM